MVANTALTFVRLTPLAVGSVAGNLPSGTVPVVNSDAFREVRLAPLPLNVVAVTTPTALMPPARTLIPVLAVINPTESIFVTSSYVRVPAIDTLPSNCASPTKVDNPVTFKSVRSPTESAVMFVSPCPFPKNEVAVTELIPDIFVALSPTIFPFAFMLPEKVDTPDTYT